MGKNFPSHIHKRNGKMHHQGKATGIYSTNLLRHLKPAIHQVSGNWFSPSHIDFFSDSVLHFFNVSFRRDFQKHLERIRFGEEISDSVLILQFVSKVLESYNTCLQRTSINLGD